MSWAKRLAIMACAFYAHSAMAAEAPEQIDEVMRQLADLDQVLSVETLDRAHEVQARLEILDQLESKLLEIAKKRQDRKALESGDHGTAREREADGRPLLELEADPRVVDIIGHGRDLTARLIASDRSGFAVKVGSKLGAYRIETISAAGGVEVVDGAGRRHNLPELEESDALPGQSTAGLVPPAGVLPVLPKR